MDLKVKWSPEAVEDVESIARYISRDSQFYARATVSKIIDFSRSISKFPQIGRMVPEFNDKQIRERLVYSYRLVYKVERSKSSSLLLSTTNNYSVLSQNGFLDRFIGLW